MKVWVSEWVPRGSIFFIADVNHPEVGIMVPIEEVDGTVVVCHPDDEQRVRDMLALIGEVRDLDEWAREGRRRRAVGPGT